MKYPYQAQNKNEKLKIENCNIFKFIGNCKLKIKILHNQKGFTLVELLIVMAIITTLTTLIFVSLDPITRFAEARNSRRTTDTNSILTAIHEFIIDNDGDVPTGLDTTERQLGICTGTGKTLCSDAADDCLNLSTDLARYFKTIPQDPGEGTSETTGYSVYLDINNIVTVKACQAELEETIEASR